MTGLMHNLCLFIITFAIKISSARKFECGEHGRFEYCIDEIPGCVVGCDCDPGYYFDADSKICEPNSKLWSRRRHSSSDRKRKQKYKKSKQSRHVRDSEEFVEGFAKVADHASELSDWISNTFFSEIEKQAEKQSKTKCVTKNPEKQRKRTHRVQKSRPKVKHTNNRRIYLKATSAERRPIRRSGDGKVNESKNIDTSMEREVGEENSTSEEYGGENASDKEIGPGDGEETDEDSESEDQDHEKHDHRHVLVVKKPKPKRAHPIPAMPVMPSFIFLPSLDTPFYPPAPLGLPAPPVVEMYPSVPVPPVPPVYPVPDPQAYTICVAPIKKTTIKPKTHKKIRETTTQPATTMTLEEVPTTKTTLAPIETTSLSTTMETKSTTQSTSTSEKLSTETKLDSTTISTLQTTITTTPLNTSTTFTTEAVNGSKSKRAHDMNEDYEYLEDHNSSQLSNRRKGFNNQRMKTIRLNDRILKNSDYKDNSLRWAHNNSKELLILNVINVPSHALKSALYQKLNDKSMPEINNTNNKYISDHIHRLEFNDHIKYLDFHPQKNRNEYSTDPAQFHEKGDDFINDPQNVHYTNLEKQIVSSVLSETNIISRTTPSNNADYLKKNKDLLLNLENQVIGNTLEGRHNVAETLQENNMTPNIVNALNNKNVYQRQELRYNINNIIPHERIVDKHNIRNREDSINKIPFWDTSNVELYKLYKNNQVINAKDPKPKQFLRHQQFNSKGTKNAVILNQSPLVMHTLAGTTRQPERSYIGRTFFSGDIM
ncbi:uncharacterized protein LOC121735278 [Aricia agestis]|uniref:uncharacterized protein LOC121735278 n=1 Tax=Aricia agestis TaxID=91739 RepID=UPI001C20B352|nr:uncharacterized protein LOC121735278 [Aricia agestis]